LQEWLSEGATILFLFLLLHRAFLKFTDYHTQTNALLHIVLV
jgi:hypothetical protein